jgi:glycosyltransferase involved in cell wall biosynthesis
MKPLVTIALPVYNGANTLKLAILSILKQSFLDWELIILDDASTDHSVEVMHSFDDSRIRLVEGEMNIGLSARLNMAVDMANGSYFARMDQDDISFPERLEKQVEYLQQHQEIDLLATAPIVFRGDGEALGCWPVFNEHEQICARPWNGFHLPHPTWMGRTDWFRQHRYDSSADGAEDQHLLLRTYQVSQFACLKEPLLAYHEGDRPLKKMLRARRIFARAYIRQFATERRYIMAIKVAVFFLLKSVADVLNLVFGVSSMRNTLLPLSASEQLIWQALWHELGGAGND